jgi:hypothetical protein
MSRTVIFKIYKFDGHIYVDMTKNELKRLIVECMNEVVIEEGAISMQEVSGKVFKLIKEIVRLYCIDFKGIPLNEEEAGVYIDQINDDIKKNLVDTKISPCPIIFSKTRLDSAGVFDIEDKQITLNTYDFLLDDYITGGYMFKPFRDIKFDVMYNTIEHELIHQQQDERSKGKYLVDRVFGNFIRKYIKGDYVDIDGVFKIMKDNPTLFKKYNDMAKKFAIKNYSSIFDRKKEIDFSASDAEFLKDVDYYNRPGELNAHAKNVVNRYVKNAIINMKTTITYDRKYKNAHFSNRTEFPSEEVRRYVLPFLNGVHGRIDKNKLISYYEGYDYLTKDNKKKWWRYVFHLLLNYKFEPIILKK